MAASVGEYGRLLSLSLAHQGTENASRNLLRYADIVEREYREAVGEDGEPGDAPLELAYHVRDLAAQLDSVYQQLTEIVRAELARLG